KATARNCFNIPRSRNERRTRDPDRATGRRTAGTFPRSGARLARSERFTRFRRRPFARTPAVGVRAWNLSMVQPWRSIAVVVARSTLRIPYGQRACFAQAGAHAAPLALDAEYRWRLCRGNARLRRAARRRSGYLDHSGDDRRVHAAASAGARALAGSLG